MGKLNAVLVGLITPAQNEERTKEYLDELAFLEWYGKSGLYQFLEVI